MLKLIAPAALMMCAESALSNNGYCAVNTPKPNVIRHYEPGQSCYKNGIFYKNCSNSPEVRY